MGHPVYDIVTNNLSLLFPFTFTMQQNEIISISNSEPQRAALSRKPQDLNNIYYTLRGPRTVCPIHCNPAISISAWNFHLSPHSSGTGNRNLFLFYRYHFLQREGTMRIYYYFHQRRDAVACEKMVSAFADIADIWATYFANDLRRRGITGMMYRWIAKNRTLKLPVEHINPLDPKYIYM